MHRDCNDHAAPACRKGPCHDGHLDVLDARLDPHTGLRELDPVPHRAGLPRLRRPRMPVPAALLRRTAPDRGGLEPARELPRRQEPPAQPLPGRHRRGLRHGGLLQHLRAEPGLRQGRRLAGLRRLAVRQRHHPVRPDDGRHLPADPGLHAAHPRRLHLDVDRYPGLVWHQRGQPGRRLPRVHRRHHGLGAGRVLPGAADPADRRSGRPQHTDLRQPVRLRQRQQRRLRVRQR
jgi:hypothetical protein